MSSYADLYVGEQRVFSWRNDLSHGMLRFFSKDNLITASGSDAFDLVKQMSLRAYEDYEEDGDEFQVTLLKIPAKELLHRLLVYGYGDSLLKQMFEMSAEYELASAQEMHDANTDKRMADHYKERLEHAKALNYESWRGEVDAVLADKEYDLVASDVSSPFSDLAYIDEGLILYLFLKDAPDDTKIIIDISDFAYDGWFDDSFLELDNIDSLEARLRSAPILITEGVFDRRVLMESIALLYPHLVPYIKFLDTDYKTEGGASAVVKTLKSFAAAGISNRIIAIFDNDTAASEALTALKGFKLPEYFRVMKYPDIELAREYPTIGPQGQVEMDVNGLAGSIEMYLGRDVLMDDKGNMLPVQWAGYSAKMKAYQGEVVDKANIQRLFDTKLRTAKEHPEMIQGQDWEGIKLIVDKIIIEFSKF